MEYFNFVYRIIFMITICILISCFSIKLLYEQKNEKVVTKAINLKANKNKTLLSYKVYLIKIDYILDVEFYIHGKIVQDIIYLDAMQYVEMEEKIFDNNDFYFYTDLKYRKNRITKKIKIKSGNYNFSDIPELEFF